MTYRLFYSPGACSLAVHIAMEEIGVPYEKEIILSRGEREGAMTATEQWRAINPKGRVPALLGVEGSMGGSPTLLTEVTAILVFLAASHPEAGLLPSAPAPLARCIEWMNWLASNVHAMSFGQIWRAQRFSDDEDAHPVIRDKGQRNLLEQYAYIDQVLGDGRRWALPEGYSAADPYLLVFFHWGQRIGLEMRRHYPAWATATDRTLSRPAVQRVLQDEGVVIA
jgi:glutathione S-transferase